MRLERTENDPVQILYEIERFHVHFRALFRTRHNSARKHMKHKQLTII